MTKKCAVCNESIEEEFGKLQGTMLKLKEDNKNQLIFVCSACQQQENWIEIAKVKSV